MTNERISQDVAYRLLSHVYRRALLECLDRHDAPVSMADAAADVARACNETPVSDVSDEELERIYLSLHHSHVPRLADRGAVSYDRDRKVVTLTERGERIITVHDRVSTDEPLEVTDAGR